MSDYFFSLDNNIKALIATLFTWFVTALGASIVYLFNDINKMLCNIMLSISAGIMTAASFWSLLAPAQEYSELLKMNTALILCTGFFSGGLFLMIADRLIRTQDKQSFMLIFSVTLHNIPEGLAVGVAFASATDYAGILSALALSLGIALQNFPEGAAVSLPLKGKGYSPNKAFFFGQLSAAVEPISALLGAYAVTRIKTLLPFALAFAAGAMIYVVINELIPEVTKENNKLIMSLFFIIGFCIMMGLDVGLG